MNDELSPELATLYKTHIPQYMSTLLEAFEDGDEATFEDVAHNLSSIMGSIGDEESMILLRKLERENLPKAENSKIIDEVSERIENALNGL